MSKSIKAAAAALMGMAVVQTASAADLPSTKGPAVFPTIDVEPLKALSAMGFDFTGYFRAGTGGTGNGGKLACFQLPGALSKYRLGNECEDYMEIALGGTVLKTADGGIFKFNTMLGYPVAGQNVVEPVTPNFVQAWVSATHVLPGALNSATFWAGKRYYMREDVHINDFFFWNTSGVGGGVQDINVGFGKFAYAFFHDTNNQLTNGYSVFDTLGARHDINGMPFLPSNRSVSRQDIRFYDVPVNPNGFLTFGGDFRLSEAGSGAFLPGQSGHDGFTVSLLHTQKELFGGKNRFAIQFGEGSGYTLSQYSDDTAGSKFHSFRIVDSLLVQPSRDWSAMFTGVIQTGYFVNPAVGLGNNAANVGLLPVKQTWYSVGMRPQYQFTNHVAFTVEVGEDVVAPSGGSTRTLTKITPAILLTAGPGFFDRPQLRLFATHAMWNQAARNAGLTGTSSANNSTTYGVQAEVWW